MIDFDCVSSLVFTPLSSVYLLGYCCLGPRPSLFVQHHSTGHFPQCLVAGTTESSNTCYYGFIVTDFVAGLVGCGGWVVILLLVSCNSSAIFLCVAWYCRYHIAVILFQLFQLFGSPQSSLFFLLLLLALQQTPEVKPDKNFSM